MADKFDEFLEEVESDIRQEKLEKLWHRYGKLIIGLVVGCLALSGGYMLWQNHQHKQNQLLSEKFVGAQNLITQGKISEALGVIKDLSNSSHKSYATLSKFYEAHLMSQKDYKAALELYQNIINSSSVEKELRDLAQVFAITLEIDHLGEENQAEAIDPILKKLEPLAGPDQPWRYLALELIGILAYKKNDFSKATDIFLQLAQDPQVPEGMHSRVQLMTQTLAAHAVD
jgi:hypothetical protein